MPNEIGNTELDVQIPELWLTLQDIIMPLYSKTRIPMRVRRFDDQARFYGDLIHVTQFPTMTVAAVGSDGTLSNQASTPTQVNLDINQWRGNKISILNRASKQANINALVAYAEAMKGALIHDVEDILLQNVADLTGTAAGDGVTPLNEEILLAAYQSAMVAELADHFEDPERMSFFLPSSEIASLYKQGFLRDYNVTGKEGGSALSILKERAIWGVPAFFTTRLNDTTYAGNNIYQAALVAKEALSLAVQKEVGIQQLPTEALARAYATDVLFGADASILARGFIIRAPR